MQKYETIALIGSFIFNIILLTVLFFKSALNEILKEWWFERNREKKKSIAQLEHFRAKFSLFSNKNMLMLILLAQKNAWLIMGKPIAPSVEENYQNALRESGEVRQQIHDELLIHLPQNLRDCFNTYNELSMGIIKKILQNQVHKEAVEDYVNELSASAMRCSSIAETILEEKLGLK